MQITIIVGPRGCGKLAKAREIAAVLGQGWREYRVGENGKEREGEWCSSKERNHRSKIECGAFLLPAAQEFTAQMFMRLARQALTEGADLILVADEPIRSEWVRALIVSKEVEVIELEPQTDAQRDFARICAIIEDSSQ